MVCKPAKQKLTCLECDKEFSFPCKLERHKLTPRFTCATCKKHFKRIDYYQKHISICSASSTSNQSVNFNEIEDIAFAPSFLSGGHFDSSQVTTTQKMEILKLFYRVITPDQCIITVRNSLRY